MYYKKPVFLSLPVGNNALTFHNRKKLWSDALVRIPQLSSWVLADVRFAYKDISYEYVDENGKLISSYGVEELIQINYHGKDVFIIDNHNHAFSLWWKSYHSGKISRWSHLIHIDQHSDFAEPEQYMEQYFSLGKDITQLTQEQIDIYTNEILTIASFIKPALRMGLCASHEMVMTEYSVLEYDISKLDTFSSIILDIDLDFRAPEMSIQEYKKTIILVRKIISLPQVGCITIATSPTYIDQHKALEVIEDLLN